MLRGSAAVPLVACALLAACGSAGAESAPAQAPAGEAASPAAAAPEAPASSEALAKDSSTAPPAAEPAADKKAPAAAPAQDKTASSQAPREVEYRMTPEGLVIAVDGVTMKPRAKAVKIKGGWGVEVTVEVKTDKPCSFSNPQNGPLSFAGNVVRKKESKRFGDERQGDDVMNVAAGASKSFSRTYPGKGEQPLYWGETLELEAGLWGVGTDGDRRPLKKLFKLKMEARDGAQAIISPPDV